SIFLAVSLPGCNDCWQKQYGAAFKKKITNKQIVLLRAMVSFLRKFTAILNIRMSLSQSLQQKLLQKLSPQQIQLMKLLQIPTAN
ncbi:hypothetical protein ACSTLD_24115, partial [Vibrio parahaemolyticus]